MQTKCNGCGQPLVPENLWLEDGCPCNTPRGVNGEGTYIANSLRSVLTARVDVPPPDTDKLWPMTSEILNSIRAKIVSALIARCNGEHLKEMAALTAFCEQQLKANAERLVDSIMSPTPPPDKPQGDDCPRCAGKGFTLETSEAPYVASEIQKYKCLWCNGTGKTVVQPPAARPESEDIADVVCADIQKRKELGTAKYGVPLRANNGRDALKDAYEEALDLAQYLRQAMEELAAYRSTPTRAVYDEATCRAIADTYYRESPTRAWILSLSGQPMPTNTDEGS